MELPIYRTRLYLVPYVLPDRWSNLGLTDVDLNPSLLTNLLVLGIQVWGEASWTSVMTKVVRLLVHWDGLM